MLVVARAMGLAACTAARQAAALQRPRRSSRQPLGVLLDPSTCGLTWTPERL